MVRISKVMERDKFKSEKARKIYLEGMYRLIMENGGKDLTSIGRIKEELDTIYRNKAMKMMDSMKKSKIGLINPVINANAFT